MIITTCNSKFDTYLQLWDEFRIELIAEDDIGCFSPQAQIIENSLPGGITPQGDWFRYQIQLSYGGESTEPIIDDFEIGISCLTPQPTTAFPGAPPISTAIPTPKPSQTQQEIFCGGTFRGSYNNEALYFRFDLFQASQVIFSLCGSNFDTYIALMDATLQTTYDDCNDCGPIGFPGDCGVCCIGNTDIGVSQLEFDILPQDRYYLYLNKIVPQDIFNAIYEIDVTCINVTTFEPTFAPFRFVTTGVPTSPGLLTCLSQTVSGQYNNEEIWMPFDLYPVDARVTFSACNSNFDTMLELWNADRTIMLNSNDDGCVGPGFVQSQLSSDLSVDRYYYKLTVGANVIGPIFDGEYVIDISCTPIIIPTQPTFPTFPVIPALPPFLIPSVGPVTPAPTRGGIIGCDETITGDYNGIDIEFRFDLTFQSIVTISACNSEFDTVLELYDDTLITLIAGCNNCGDGGDCDENAPGCCSNNPLASEIIIPLERNRYYIQLFAPSDAITIIPARFEITVICPTAPTPASSPIEIPTVPIFPTLPTTQIPTSPGILYCDTGTITGDYNNEAIIMPFILEPEPGIVTFSTCQTLEFDTYIELWNEDQTIKIAEDDSGCSNGIQAELTQTLFPGTYYYQFYAVNPNIFAPFIIEIRCNTLPPSVPLPAFPPIIPSPVTDPTQPTLPTIPTQPTQPTISPTRPNAISCGETVIGEYNDRSIYFRFDLNPFESQVIFRTCGSSFDTVITLWDATLSNIFASCSDCGIEGLPGDCTQNSGQSEICCDGLRPDQSEIIIDLFPNRYNLELSSETTGIRGEFFLEIICDNITPTTSSPSRDPALPSRPPNSVPVSWPTRQPFEGPSECNEYCDAYSIKVEEVYTIEEDICITYNVERILENGYYCYQPIKYFVLGVCDGDSIDNGGKCNQDDLNGLITSFEVLFSDDDIDSDDENGWSLGGGYRRRMGKRRKKYSKNAWGTSSNSVYGVRINQRIYQQLVFEICLINVFNDNGEMSSNVAFRRGKDRFICNNNEWIVGLPCIDNDKFQHGAYGQSGYNGEGEIYGDYYRKNYRVEIGGVEVSNINDLKIDNSIIARWEVLSCIILGSLCFIGCLVIYCIILRKKKRLKRERIATFDDDDIDKENEEEEEETEQEIEHEEEDDDEEEDSLDGDIGSIKTNNKKRIKFRREKYKKHYRNITESDEVELQDLSENEITMTGNGY